MTFNINKTGIRIRIQQIRYEKHFQQRRERKEKKNVLFFEMFFFPFLMSFIGLLFFSSIFQNFSHIWEKGAKKGQKTCVFSYLFCFNCSFSRYSTRPRLSLSSFKTRKTKSSIWMLLKYRLNLYHSCALFFSFFFLSFFLFWNCRLKRKTSLCSTKQYLIFAYVTRAWYRWECNLEKIVEKYFTRARK